MILTANPVSLWPLIQRLQQVFHAQGLEVRMRLRRAVQTGEELTLTHWDQPMFDMLRHMMRPYWNAGLVQGKRELDLAILRSKGLRRAVRKDWLSDLGLNLTGNSRTFSLANPSVLDAIDAATMTFCTVTNQTATTDLNTAIARLRLELKEGVQAGEAHVDLAKRVQTLFNDPSRANTIAVTESSRATNGGSVLMYERSGAAEGVQWLTTRDPCRLCAELDGEERPFGEPFAIKKGGGPYAVIYHPPYHPHCFLRRDACAGILRTDYD